MKQQSQEGPSLKWSVVPLVGGNPTGLELAVTGTISIYTLGHLLGEAEHLWVCLECNEVGS